MTFRNRILEYGVKPADQFLAHPKNARIHPVYQREVMKSALDTVGFVAPVIEAKSGYLLDGHERIFQALAQNNAPVPYVVVDVDEDEEAYVLATFDPITALANYDAELLDGLLREVNSDNEHVQKMLAELAADAGLYVADESQVDPEPQIDRASELQQTWQTEVGQLWVIGKHRLLVGDCTIAANVERLMAGEKAALVVTDPPYGVEYDPEWRDDLEWQEKGTASGETIKNDDNFDWMKAFSFVPSDVLYVWLASNWLATVQFGIEAFGFTTKYLIIWNKDLAPIGRGHYHWKHEPCLYMVRKGANTNWQGARDQSTVWDIPTIHSFANGHNRNQWGLVGHGNQKPVECMARPIKNNSSSGSIVYDPFGGSGTTMVACEQLARQCRMMELEPKYAAVILQRMSDMGLEPRLERA